MRVIIIYMAFTAEVCNFVSYIANHTHQAVFAHDATESVYNFFSFARISILIADILKAAI